MLLISSYIKSYLSSEDYNSCEVIVVSSETLALHYALKAVGVKRGDVVCLPSFTDELIIKEVLALNAIPVLIGSEWSTWNMDYELLEEGVKEIINITGIRPKAVVMCSVYGMPAFAHNICEVCFRHNIPVIDYCCNALGSELYGRKMGTFGQYGYGIISFGNDNSHSTDNGAALVCNGVEDKKQLLKLISRHRGVENGLDHYKDAVTNPILKLEERIVHQRYIYSLYERLLKDVNGISLHSQPDINCPDGAPIYFNSNYNHCNILVSNNKSITQLQEALSESNIQTKRLYKPLHTYPQYANYPIYTNGICDDVYKRGLSLPSGIIVVENDIMNIVKLITKWNQKS